MISARTAARGSPSQTVVDGGFKTVVLFVRLGDRGHGLFLVDRR
jgi:hypothetical protein